MTDGRYTEKELLKLFADAGWTQLQFKMQESGADTLPDGNTLAHWFFRGVQDPVDGASKTKGFNLFKWPDGTFTFQDKNPLAPKPEIIEEPAIEPTE